MYMAIQILLFRTVTVFRATMYHGGLDSQPTHSRLTIAALSLACVAFVVTLTFNALATTLSTGWSSVKQYDCITNNACHPTNVHCCQSKYLKLSSSRQ